jgi:hypothetical protein
MSKQETVKVTVTVEIPKKVHQLLEKFAAFAGVSLEEMLRDQLEPDIRGFWQSEGFQDWAQYAIEEAGCAEYFQIEQGETE